MLVSTIWVDQHCERNGPVRQNSASSKPKLVTTPIRAGSSSTSASPYAVTALFTEKVRLVEARGGSPTSRSPPQLPGSGNGRPSPSDQGH